MAAVGAVATLAPRAAAGPYTEVASAFDDDDRFDLHLTLTYGFDNRRAAIKREYTGLIGTLPNGPMPIVKDLLFRETRHTLTPKITLGIFHDVQASLALPIVISDARTLEFDQRSTPCVFPAPGVTAPTCINEENSTTVQDGLLPADGFDSDDPSGPGFTNPDDNMLFRSPKRSGLDQLELGVAWAAMNQLRDDTKPTWFVGFDLRLAVGKTMSFNRDDPSADAGVSRGVHELRLWTSVAKRVTWAEPFFEMWWQAPIGHKSDSHFIDAGFGERRDDVQQQAGTRFGFEAVAWENPASKLRIDLEFAARVQALFEGKDYTEMWEVFQYAGESARSGPLALDSDPTQAGVQELDHPGVSNVENYLTFGAHVGLNAQIGDRVRFGLSYELRNDQSHLITFADAGVDKPTCQGAASASCEIDDNEVVDADTDEVNPMHVPLIDVTGHRYRIDEVTDNAVMVWGKLVF